MLNQARVMARDELPCADAPREREQLGEAEAAVAAHARVWCLAARVSRHEWSNDRAAERLAKIEGDVRKPEAMAGMPRRHDRLRRTAGAIGGRPTGVGPQAKRHPNGLVARIARAQKRDSAVDSAAHGHRHASRLGLCAHRRPKRVVKSIGREGFAGHGRGGERRQAAHFPAKLGDARSLSLRSDDAIAFQGQAYPGEVAVTGGIADQFPDAHSGAE